MNNLTLHQLRCFDAVVTQGNFQAAADLLCRSQPTVFTAVKSLEKQIGLSLLDRSNYRVKLTDAGQAFHARTRIFLEEYHKLDNHITQLAMDVETELHVVIGDLCPTSEILALLRRFFQDRKGTQLHLHFEAISGPWERLRDGNVDLIFHHIDQSDPGLEYIDMRSVRVIPVVAPNFLAFPITDTIAPEQMRDYVQCIIRDSAKHSEPRNYYVMEGSRSLTVSDQLMKKEIILQGMGWGHMPEFLIREELNSGHLLPITGKHFRGGLVDLVVARNRNIAHGPVAEQLWRYLEEQLTPE